MVSTQDIIEKYFKGKRLIYFQQSDAHHSIEGDTYLRYSKDGGVQLWFGGNNGEVCILHTRDGETFEKVIKLMMNP